MAEALLQTLDELLASPRESCIVEFKSNLNQPKEIGEYISALANSAALEDRSRAWLVWGVDNDSHVVTGTAFDPFGQKIKDGNQALIMWLQVMTTPRADFAFHEADHPLGRVVVLEIHPARSAPIAFQHVRYIRIDSHKVQLADHPDKEARLWNRLGLKTDWSGELVPGATLDDLDPEAVSKARERFAEFLLRAESKTGRHAAIRAEAAPWSMTTLLNKARITKQGRMMRAALLLLGRDESAHSSNSYWTTCTNTTEPRGPTWTLCSCPSCPMC